VPLTPKTDATTAASTAPTADAAICRKENFTSTNHFFDFFDHSRRQAHPSARRWWGPATPASGEPSGHATGEFPCSVVPDSIPLVREGWLCGRAISLHLGLSPLVAACGLATGRPNPSAHVARRQK
jgi:hypothetical protein